MVEIIGIDKFKEEIFDYSKDQEFTFSKDQPIILNFFAEWCGPCKAFSPTLEQVAKDYKEQLKVFKIDIDKTPEIPSLFGIRSVPTTVFFAPQAEPISVLGAQRPDQIARAINEIFSIPTEGQNHE